MSDLFFAEGTVRKNIQNMNDDNRTIIDEIKLSFNLYQLFKDLIFIKTHDVILLVILLIKT